MAKRIIRSASFPQSFIRTFHHAANSSDPIVIEQLEPDVKKTYISLRARLNEFRKAFHTEAVASGDARRIELADSFYSVVIRDPEQQVDGRWKMIIEVRYGKFGDVLDKFVPDNLPTLPPHESSNAQPEPTPKPLAEENALPLGTGDVGTKALSELFDDIPKMKKEEE